MHFGERVLDYFENLPPAPPVPSAVEVLYPHRHEGAWGAMQAFYGKFYRDHAPRVFLIGINPGRLGAGTTGVPFTDPIRLQQECGIDHPFELKAELSSKFIYQMINGYGGVADFYKSFFFTSVSPLGFTREGKNLNYYDLKELQNRWEPFMVASLRTQAAFGCKYDIAFSLGQGKNYQYLRHLNEKYHLFRQITPLPHPRWIMQYRLKKLPEFISLYCKKLKEALNEGR